MPNLFLKNVSLVSCDMDDLVYDQKGKDPTRIYFDVVANDD